ncbi:hypothetical protein SELMODRAFT_268118 [Selaginella moellendorffii]|uniref:Protein DETOXIFICATION n=1 Tax=Selaginella moellendorffii TaxID=88036 RepID=D8S3G0_SELML|nr:protein DETOXIFICATION 16 [Selaginella moellendorffii]EFJ21258.1 hypothetical protein SELMODRAFT_268118 [Selaginella moellendorffii]|eukprot:XP_002977920.1 protein DETOXIFICATION 16 [Selaginella moellendorffii]
MAALSSMSQRKELDLEQEEEDATHGRLANRVRAEIGRQLWLALPMMGVNLLQYSIQLVSVMFVGHLGELDLSGASIASSFCNVTGFSILLGLASALETLCGQAYGAKQYHTLGILLQRAICILIMISIPLALLFYNMEPVLLFFGQAPDISLKAGIYARYLIPGLLSYALIQPLMRFLQTQSCVVPMLFCSVVSLLVHILLCWIMIHKLGIGAHGAAISLSICFWLNAGFFMLLVAFIPRCKKCWPGFSTEAFRDFKLFLRLAVPSAIMVCVEWWAFELLLLLSGLLPNPQLQTSVYSIILNTVSFTFMIPYGIGIAASTRISNELGAGQVSNARFAFFVTLGLALLDATTMAILLFLARHFLGRVYSNEPEVINNVAKLGPIIALISFMDDIQGSISGVARGCGWQATAAAANLGAYYIVGVPIAYSLAFHFGLNGKGLVIGILCGTGTQAITFLLISSVFTNWEKQAENATKRVETSATLPLLS